MTLFEKIYWTLLVVTAILGVFSITEDENENEKIPDRMKIPLAVQLFVTFVYLIVKFLLWIWGVSIDLFPSCPLL